MGVKHLPSYRDFWSTSKMLHDSYISALMPVKRFSWLLSNLHTNDNALQPRKGEPNFDKLYKLQPFLTKLQENFSKCFKLSKNVAIDESMIRYKGRSTLKQYMPKKPIKRGYKVWMLADESGYCGKFQIYTGKRGDNAEKNLGARVVKDLCKGLEGKGHNVYFDNYFTSVPLLSELQRDEIYACGTVNSNRKHLPIFLADKELQRGDFDFSVSNGGLTAIKWKDKRSVYLLSNYHDPKVTSQVKRKKRDGTSESVPCPQVLIDYNKHMNAVDKFDQNKGSYEVDRKSRKWWHRIFFYFLDACVVNSYVIYMKMLEL